MGVPVLSQGAGFGRTLHAFALLRVPVTPPGAVVALYAFTLVGGAV